MSAEHRIGDAPSSVCCSSEATGTQAEINKPEYGTISGRVLIGCLLGLLVVWFGCTDPTEPQTHAFGKNLQAS